MNVLIVSLIFIFALKIHFYVKMYSEHHSEHSRGFSRWISWVMLMSTIL